MISHAPRTLLIHEKYHRPCTAHIPSTLVMHYLKIRCEKFNHSWATGHLRRHDSDDERVMKIVTSQYYCYKQWLHIDIFKLNYLSESYWGTSTHISQIAKFMGPTWGPPGSCRPQMGPMLAPWTLLSGMLCLTGLSFEFNHFMSRPNQYLSRCSCIVRPECQFIRYLELFILRDASVRQKWWKVIVFVCVIEYENYKMHFPSIA